MSLITAHRLLWAAFTTLNFVRFTTVVALLVGAAAQLVTLAVDLSVRARDRTLDLGTFDMYYPSTDIPGASGGTCGWTLSHILITLILLTSAVAEIPIPPPFKPNMEAFWLATFPSYSQQRGVQMLGLVMITFGTTELARNSDHLVRAAAWILFVVGLVNLVIGLALRESIHNHRSIDAIDPNDAHSEGVRPNAATYVLKPALVNISGPTSPSRVHFALPSFARRFSRQQHTQTQQPDPHSPSLYSTNTREVRVEIRPDQQPSDFSANDFSHLGPMIQIKPQ